MNPPSPYDLPPLTMAAIFLDMDGTLAPIARRPVDVRVANDMLMLLDLLHTRTEGAIAILTGRPAWQIDDLLAPRLYALAAEHGAGVRMADGKTLTAAARHLDVALLERTVRHALQSIDDIYIERKDHGIAVHYRQAPRQGGLIAEQTTRIAANTEGVEVLNGKMVIELKAVGVNKGLALNTLMAHPPFAGRTPVVFGDDTTDEAAFAQANAEAGMSVRIGGGPIGGMPSCAQFSLANQQALAPFLQAWLSTNTK